MFRYIIIPWIRSLIIGKPPNSIYIQKVIPVIIFITLACKLTLNPMIMKNRRQKAPACRQAGKFVLIYAKMRILVTLLFLTYSFLLFTQNVENIDLPSGSGGGSTIGDIITANGKIFAYSADGVSIYDAASNAFITKVLFTETLGKFNPVYYSEWVHVPDQSIMVYNNEPGHQYIFTLTPKLKLMVINTNPPYNTWTTSLNMSMSAESWLDEVLQSQNGRVLLKYDNTVTNYNHHRLYVLVGGRDQISNETGNFHQKTHFFGIYNIDYNMLPGTPGYANLIYTETNIPGDYYGNQINNYVFNQ
ncbi:MAG: hypothetical protein COW63_16785, partial [Bacteroidetes bacterium CG18_big_fil_WC_8_21_14_2_50_41_14]